jgi:predicted transcriptional regulator
MRRSKLKRYEDILCSLYSRAKTIDEIAFNTNMDCVALRFRIDFLLKNRLIEEINGKKAVLYNLTNRGLSIYKTITITRRLEKLQTNIQTAHKNLEILSIFPNKKQEKIKKQKK